MTLKLIVLGDNGHDSWEDIVEGKRLIPIASLKDGGAETKGSSHIIPKLLRQITNRH